MCLQIHGLMVRLLWGSNETVDLPDKTIQRSAVFLMSGRSRKWHFCFSVSVNGRAVWCWASWDKSCRLKKKKKQKKLIVVVGTFYVILLNYILKQGLCSLWRNKCTFCALLLLALAGYLPFFIVGCGKKLVLGAFGGLWDLFQFSHSKNKLRMTSDYDLLCFC